MLFSCVFFLTLYTAWNSPKMFSPQMLLPVWELCCYYDVLPVCMMCVSSIGNVLLYVFFNSWIALHVWGNSLFCVFPISSCRNATYQLLHTGRHSNTCELLSASLTKYPYHILSPASKWYCWACLLQCLSTKLYCWACLLQCLSTKLYCWVCLLQCLSTKLYCWACLLQCLSTKAQSQTWQSHS
jgi:hypothetical protein